MRNFLFATAALAAISFSSGVTAQAIYGGADDDRECSTVFVFDDSFNALAGVSISYSTPEWKDDYDQMLDKLKGRNLRLGKNWWTSFDTATDISMAGVKIAAGSYFLGLHCDDKGSFSLLVFDSTKAMKSKMLPFTADSWSGGIQIPLKLEKGALEESVEEMEIEIAADKSNWKNGTFEIRWGKHKLSADVKFAADGGSADEAAAEKK